MTTAIIVDSAAALPKVLIDRYSIHIVPMHVIIDGESRPDISITTDELLGHLEAGDVTTSGPSPGEWASAIEKALIDADEVVALTVSSEMSTTLQAARIAASTISGPVHVVDTRSAAGGEGLIALAAAERAAAGADVGEVLATVDTLIDRIHLVATLDSLAHLARSGRVPNIASTAAHAFRVNPMFEFRDGAARALHPAIGHQAADNRIIHSCLASRPDGTDNPKLHAAVLEAASHERARSLLRALHREVPDADVFVASFGAVMLVHVGPGLVGLAWWWEP